MFSSGHYEEANAYYDKALAIDPDNALALSDKQLGIDNLG
jgi:tetratricopeptide (TPR) repeat protein